MSSVRTLPAQTEGWTGSRRLLDSRTPMRVLFATGVLVYLWRVHLRLQQPGIFAEDGLIFYLQADEIGWGAVFRPYAGYLHVVPRLISLVVEPLGLPAVPLCYAAAAIAVTLCGFAVVTSRRFDRVIPHPALRGLAFLGLCLVPQVWETSAVVASLIFAGGVPLILLALCRTPASIAGRVIEALAVLLLGLSGPLIVFYSPLYVYRWIRDRTWANAGLVVVVACAAATQALVFFGSGRATAGLGFSTTARAYTQRVAGELLTSPSNSQQAFEEGSPLMWYVIVWLMLVVLFALIELRWTALAVLAVTCLAFTWANNAYGFMLFESIYGDRHILVPSSTLLVLLIGTLSWGRTRSRQGRYRRLHSASVVITSLLLGVTIVGLTARFTVPAFDRIPSQSQLATFQSCLDAGRRDCAVVPIAPVPFRLSPHHPYDPGDY